MIDLVNIIIIGDDITNIEQFLFQIISQKSDCILSTKNTFFNKGTQPEYCIMHYHNIQHITCENTILLFTPGCQLTDNFKIIGNFQAVVSSDNEDVIQKLAKQKIKAITYGLSAKNTITLSSMKEDSVVISLQRCINTLFGEIIEASDIPLYFNGNIDQYCIMLITAALLISGFYQKLEKITINYQ